MEYCTKEYDNQILDLLFTHNECIYYIPLACIDENIYCYNKDDFLFYRDSTSEYACFPKDFSWVYYQSHEGTVTFAGTIMEKAKLILSQHESMWNEYRGG